VTSRLVFPTARTVAILNVYETRSGNDVLDALAGQLAQERTKAPHSGWQQSAEALHNLLVAHGDRDSFRRSAGADPIGWYMAAAELAGFFILENSIVVGQIGTIHMYGLSKDGSLVSIAPVHNVACEMKSGTIGESCLSPFDKDHFEQLHLRIRGTKPRVNASFETFVREVGHFPSRMVGYFQQSPKLVGRYPDLPPRVSSTEAELAQLQAVVFYIPALADLAQGYEGKRIVAEVTRVLKSDSVTTVFGDHDVLRGQLVRVDVGGGRLTATIIGEGRTGLGKA
jgi:hypothetical protein